MSEKLETVGWVECDTHPELGFLGLVLHHRYVEGGWPVVRQDQHESILSERDATIEQQAGEIERESMLWEFVSGLPRKGESE